MKAQEKKEQVEKSIDCLSKSKPLSKNMKKAIATFKKRKPIIDLRMKEIDSDLRKEIG